MAEQRLSELDVQDGGSHSLSAWLGGAIALLGGLQMPAALAQSANTVGQGNHLTELIDLFWSLAQRLGAPPPYVYHDSTDSDVQFSVAASTFDINGTVVSYAGQINRGPLTTGATNFIWLDLSNLASVSAASGAAWPGTPHLRLAAIAQPSSNAWRSSHLTRHLRLALGSVHGQQVGRRTIQTAFNYNTSSPVTIGTVPAGARIRRVRLDVETAFNGTAPTLEVGDAGDADRLMAAGDSDPKTAGLYSRDCNYVHAAATAVTLTITPDSSSAGAGFVEVEYLP